VLVDKKARKILNIIITDSSTGDAKEFIPLLEPIENVKVAAADGANDSNKNFEYCDDRHILPLIPVHINAIGGSLHRKLHVEEQLGVIRRRVRNGNVIPPKEIHKKESGKRKSESCYHM